MIDLARMNKTVNVNGTSWNLLKGGKHTTDCTRVIRDCKLEDARYLLFPTIDPYYAAEYNASMAYNAWSISQLNGTSIGTDTIEPANAQMNVYGETDCRNDSTYSSDFTCNTYYQCGSADWTVKSVSIEPYTGASTMCMLNATNGVVSSGAKILAVSGISTAWTIFTVLATMTWLCNH